LLQVTIGGLGLVENFADPFDASPVSSVSLISAPQRLLSTGRTIFSVLTGQGVIEIFSLGPR
jgi:hypothetical protein